MDDELVLKQHQTTMMPWSTVPPPFEETSIWKVPHLRLPSKRRPGRLQLLLRHHRVLHPARGQRGPLRGEAGGAARHGRGTCGGAPEGQEIHWANLPKMMICRP